MANDSEHIEPQAAADIEPDGDAVGDTSKNFSDDVDVGDVDAAADVGDVDAADGGDDGGDDDANDGCCNRCCTRLGCGFCCRCLAGWPRTAGLFFGVVFPLFLLIFVSVICGYGLAQLEGPSEIENNNDIIATRIAVDFQKDLVGNITEALPHICACTFLTEEEFDINDDLYQQCLEEQRIQNETIAAAKAALEIIFTNTNNTNTTFPGNFTNATITYNGTFPGNFTTAALDDALNAEPIECTEPISLEGVAIEETIQRIFVKQFKPCENQEPTPLDDVTICGETGVLDFPDSLTMSPSDLLTSMSECGNAALEITMEYKMSDIIVLDLLGSGISFNWVRCPGKDTDDDSNKTDADRAGGLVGGTVNELFNPFADLSHLLPSAQEEAVIQAWKESQQDLYCHYLDEGLAAGKKLTVARFEALERSIAEADGFGDCTVNTWAGGWFWFTVMTTIGYGNTAPVTQGGRAMIFTLGFFSILLFAGILAKAGSIIVAIIDDFLDRIKLHILTWPSIQAVVWGAFYYLWSLMIASYYVYWSEDRLGAEVPYDDAYWFAYITTTTVGLGDYYLEHGVIVGLDLLTWPLLILFGFVLLSAFLTKVGELLAGLFAKEESASFAEILAAEDRPLFSCCPNLFQRTHSARREEMVRAESIASGTGDASDGGGEVDANADAVVAESIASGTGDASDGDGEVDANADAAVADPAVDDPTNESDDEMSNETDKYAEEHQMHQRGCNLMY